MILFSLLLLLLLPLSLLSFIMSSSWSLTLPLSLSSWSLWYSPHNKVVGEYIGFSLSVRPCVRPSVVPHPVPSVARKVLVGFILYSYILSSNFRRCVACKVFCQIWKYSIFVIFHFFYFWLCLVLTWDLMGITSMGNQVGEGYLRTQASLLF